MPDATPFNSKQPFHNSWRAYREKGYVAPLYLPANAKAYPPKGYTGGAGKWPTDTELLSWADGVADENANVCLRLGFPIERTDELPLNYAEHIGISTWVVVGIDVDNYVKNDIPKQAGFQLWDLEEDLGPLPETAIITKRFDDWKNGRLGEGLDRPDVLPGIRLFLIPNGVRLQSSLSPDIEVIQGHHRYAVAPPSVVDGRQYVFAWGTSTLAEIRAGIIPVADIPLLPEKWLQSKRIIAGRGSHDDGVRSQLKDSELETWAKNNLPKPLEEHEFDDIRDARLNLAELGGAMCYRLGNAVRKFFRIIAEEERSHDPLRDIHCEIAECANEGHRGWLEALAAVNKFWLGDVGDRNKRGYGEAVEEIARSWIGALARVEPKHEPGCTEKCWSAEKQQREFRKYGADRLGKRMHAKYDNNIEEYGDVVGSMELQLLEDDDCPRTYPQSDVGNAQHMIDIYGTDIKYVAGYREWIVWSQGRWWRDSEAERAIITRAFDRVRKRLVAMTEKYYKAYEAHSLMGPNADKAAMAKAKKAWDDVSRQAQQTGNDGRITAAIKYAAKRTYNGELVEIQPDKVDGNDKLLGVANGVLHLDDTGAWIEPARQEDYVTRNTGVEWTRFTELVRRDEDDDGGWHNLKTFLDKFLPDPAVQRYAQKLLGYSLIGSNPERMLLFLYGDTTTGKSTLVDIVCSALGDYATQDTLRLLEEHKLNPALAEALPMRVIGIDEVDDGIVSNAAAKRVTGGGPMVAELKGKNDQIRRIPAFKLFISTNRAPHIPGADEALHRRIQVISFGVKLSEAEEKQGIRAQLREHCREAALSWLVEGWDMYCREGFPKGDDIPECCRNAKREFKSELTDTGEYINNYLEIAPPEVFVAVNRNMNMRNRLKPTPKDWQETGNEEWLIDRDTLLQEYEIWEARNAGSDKFKNRPSNKFTREMGGWGVLLGQHKVDGERQFCYMGCKIKERLMKQTLRVMKGGQQN